MCKKCQPICRAEFFSKIDEVISAISSGSGGTTAVPDYTGLLTDIREQLTTGTTVSIANKCDGSTDPLPGNHFQVVTVPHEWAVQKVRQCQMTALSEGKTANFTSIDTNYIQVTTLTEQLGSGITGGAMSIPPGTREVNISLDNPSARAFVRITLNDGSVITHQFRGGYVYRSANDLHRKESDVSTVEIASTNGGIDGFVNLLTVA